MLVNLNSLTQSAIWCFAWRVALAHPGLLPTESNFFSTPVRHNSAQEYFPEEVSRDTLLYRQRPGESEPANLQPHCSGIGVHPSHFLFDRQHSVESEPVNFQPYHSGIGAHPPIFAGDGAPHSKMNFFPTEVEAMLSLLVKAELCRGPKAVNPEGSQQKRRKIGESDHSCRMSFLPMVQSHLPSTGNTIASSSLVGTGDYFERSWSKIYHDSCNPSQMNVKPVEFNMITSCTPQNTHSHIQVLEVKDQYNDDEELILKLKKNIGENFLKKFTDRFETRIEHSMKKIVGGSKRLHTVELGDIPIKIYKCQLDMLYSIRIPNTENNFKIESIGSLIQCKKLIECLLFINTSVLVHLYPEDRNYQEEFYSHDQLINWLYKEIFDPGNNRLPLIGTLEEIKGRHFGECQKILISFLSRQMGPHSELKAALKMIQFYYLEFQDQIVHSLKNIDNDLNASLRKLLENGIKSHLLISENLENLDVNILRWEGLESLVMMPFEKLSKKLKLRKIKCDCKLLFNQEEQNILERYDHLVLPNVKKPGITKKKLNDLPFLVYYTRKYTGTVILKRFIWTIKNQEDVHHRRAVKSRIQLILLILKACHLQLTKYIATRVELEEIHEKFDKKSIFNWINELLMGKDDVRIPLFGEFVLTKGSDLYDDHTIPSNFSPAQIELVKYLSISDYSQRVFYLSLSLIFCWYKNQNNHMFMHIFPDENTYWEEMSGRIEKLIPDGAQTLTKTIVDDLLS